MAEPGTPAQDIPTIYAQLRLFEEKFDARSKRIEQSLADLGATLQASEPTSSERRTGRSSARRKARPLPARSRADDIASLLNKASKDVASFINETRKDFAALTNETHEKVNALAKGIHPLSQVSQEPQARAEENGSPILGQEQSDPGREGRTRSEDDAPHGLTRSSAGHIGGRKDAVDSSLPHLRSGSHEQAVPAGTESHATSDPSPQINAATSPETISDAAQQPQVHPADDHDEGSPRPPPPRDGGTAKQDDDAAAQDASTHQRREAEPENQAPVNTHGDNSTIGIEASRDPSSDGSDEDIPMRDCEQVQLSPPGSMGTAASTASASQSAPRQAPAADTRPELADASADHQDDISGADRQLRSGGEGQHGTTSGEQEHEPDGHDPDTPMTDAEEPTRGRQDLAKRAAEATAVTSAQASPNDSISNREDTANAQISALSLSRGTTPQTTQSPATPNPSRQDGNAHLNVQDTSHGATPRGSDTTEDTSRAITPDTHLTSPDTAVPASPPNFTLSEADMGEGLVQALDKLMSHPDFANKVSVPLPGIDPAEIQKGLDVDYTHCQHTGVRFEAGPKGEGYANVFVSKYRRRLDWSKFRPELVQEPTIEEAEEILNRFINNPPDHSIPYIIGHLKTTPFNEALNPGPAILGDLNLKDLHSEYHHIGLDGSANRFHQEDGTWEDESDGSHHGLCSYNEVYYGYKLWCIVKVHHISKFRNWAQAKWNCTKCSQGLSHQCLLISPATLRKAGIDFRIEVSKPGKAVVTLEGQQHMILNYGLCASRSMNFYRAGEKMQFQKVVYCDEDDMAPIYAIRGAIRINPPTQPGSSASASNGGRKVLPSASKKQKRSTGRKSDWADAVPRQSKRVKRRQDNDGESMVPDAPQVTLESLQQLADKFRAQNLLYKVPTLHADQLPTERVFRLACAMSSRLAIQQFHSMVQSWNGRYHLFEHTPLPGEDPISRIQHRALLVDKCASMDTLSSYLLRQSQFGLAKEVEAYRQGQLRTDSSFIDKIRKRTSWTLTSYKYHYNAGKKWMAIDGLKEGTLPFINRYTDPFNISPTVCLDLGEDELSSLDSLLDNDLSKALFKAGVAFQQAVEGSRSVRFAWDGHEVNWDSLDENKLMLDLEVVDD